MGGTGARPGPQGGGITLPAGRRRSRGGSTLEESRRGLGRRRPQMPPPGPEPGRRRRRGSVRKQALTQRSLDRPDSPLGGCFATRCTHLAPMARGARGRSSRPTPSLRTVQVGVVPLPSTMRPIPQEPFLHRPLPNRTLRIPCRLRPRGLSARLLRTDGEHRRAAGKGQLAPKVAGAGLYPSRAEDPGVDRDPSRAEELGKGPAPSGRETAGADLAAQAVAPLRHPGGASRPLGRSSLSLAPHHRAGRSPRVRRCRPPREHLSGKSALENSRVGLRQVGPAGLASPALCRLAPARRRQRRRRRLRAPPPFRRRRLAFLLLRRPIVHARSP